jgi:hypothetical protein
MAEIIPPKTKQVLDAIDDALIRIFDNIKRSEKLRDQSYLTGTADRLVLVRKAYLVQNSTNVEFAANLLPVGKSSGTTVAESTGQTQKIVG